MATEIWLLQFSDESLGKFVMISRALKNNPRLEFFHNKKSKISKKHWQNVLVVRFDFKIRSPDIIWGQIKRATSSLARQLELAGFSVLRSGSHTDQQKEACMFFLLESQKIPETYVKKGPEFFREDSSKGFILKNKKSSEIMWVGNDQKIMSIEKRKHVEADKFLAFFLKNNLKTGMPGGLEADLKRGFKVTMGEKNLSKSIKKAAGELISTDGTFLHFN